MRITIPGDPQPKQRPRHANGRVYTPKETRVAEDIIKWMLASSKVRPLAGDLIVRLNFRVSHQRKCDIDNLIKLVLDAANGTAWKDDAQIIGIHAMLERGSPNPGTDLEVRTT